jgi:hypothetical protein
MGELLDKDQAAERYGIAAATLIAKASLTRNMPAAERTRYDCPLPVKHEDRESGMAMGPRTVSTPLWDSDELDAWRAAGRRPPRRERARDEAGRYAPAGQP